MGCDDSVEGGSTITNVVHARQRPSVVVVIIVPKRAATKHSILDGPLNKAERCKFPPSFAAILLISSMSFGH